MLEYRHSVKWIINFLGSLHKSSNITTVPLSGEIFGILSGFIDQNVTFRGIALDYLQ